MFLRLLCLGIWSSLFINDLLLLMHLIIRVVAMLWVERRTGKGRYLMFGPPPAAGFLTRRRPLHTVSFHIRRRLQLVIIAIVQ